MKSLIVLFLITGLLISLYGRVEAESVFHSHPNDPGITHQQHNDTTTHSGENHPVGPHKDQHGCYHSHAPLHLPSAVSLLSPIFSSVYLTETTQLFFPKIAFNITHSPRA